MKKIVLILLATMLGMSLNSCTSQPQIKKERVYIYDGKDFYGDIVPDGLPKTVELVEYNKNIFYFKGANEVKIERRALDELCLRCGKNATRAKVEAENKKELEQAGYDYAVAIATQAEIEAGAACGQLSIICE